MQVLIQVVCTKGPSLRQRIADHPRLTDESGLKVTKYKKQSVAHGWTSLKLPGAHGSIKMTWDGSAQALAARVVTKGGDPEGIIGAFLGFVLRRFPKRVVTINIVPLK